MSRQIKLAIAAVATTLVATMGVAGISTTADAGKSGPSYRDHSYCC